MSKPRKRLPVKPSAEHLRKQAKRRQRLQGEITLAQAQHQLAREYGAKNWPELLHMVETMLRGADQLANVRYEWEALPKAVNEDDLDRVHTILDEGAFTQHDLDLALARALNFPKRKPFAELLIEHGADVDGQYGSDYGPIVLVCGEGLQADALAFMIEQGCDVSFPPVPSKYGPASPMLHTLSTYVRNHNEAKHRCIDLLEENGAVMPDLPPEVMAIHRGHAEKLTAILETDSGLVRRTYPDMPFGNLKLKGGTLLHLAAEFAEIECIDVLLDHGADLEQPADIIDGIGGQTPIFHAAMAYHYWKAPALPHLIQRAGNQIDTRVRATVQKYDETVGPVTVMEFFHDDDDVLEQLRLLEGT